MTLIDAAGDSGSLENGCRRSRRRSGRVGGTLTAAGLVAAVALLALAPATASAELRDARVYVHSAESGELGGGRLTLRGVGRRVTWAAHPGRFGVIGVRRLHRRLFSSGTPAPVGTLHVAGHRGGEELVLRLSRPRSNVSRGTVSYRVKRLNKGRLPRRAARAAGAARRFGSASLTIQGAPPPSVDVQQTTYSCDSGTCWGTLTASGLPPGTDVTGFAPQVPGNTGQGENIDVRADGNGNINTQLDFLCNNDYHVTNPNVSIDATSVTPSFSVHAPGSCG